MASAALPCAVPATPAGRRTDLAERDFDVALCRFGLMFFADRGRVLARIRRLLAPGGRFAAAVWDVPERALHEAGFGEVQIERVTATVELPSAEAYARFRRDLGGPLVDRLAELPAKRQAEVWNAISGAATAHAGPDGTLRMRNVAICAVARQEASRGPGAG